MMMMRKARIWILSAAALLALLSVRDKEISLTVPSGKELVAEASGPLAASYEVKTPVTPLVAASTPAISVPRLSSGSTPGTFSEFYSTDLNNIDLEALPPGVPLQDATGAVETTPSGDAAPADTDKKAEDTAAAPAALVYGFGNTTDTGSGGSDSSSSSSASSAKAASSAPAAAPKAFSYSPGSACITKLTPESGIAGIDVIIQGAGFSGIASSNVVKFGDSVSDNVRVVSVNQLRAKVPVTPSAGIKPVTVTVAGKTSNISIFDILKDSSKEVYLDRTPDLLPSGTGYTDSSIIRLSDIDGDNDLDMLVFDTEQDKAFLFINDLNVTGKFKDATTQLPTALSVGGRAVTDAAFGDIDSDGFEDIVVSYPEEQSIAVYLNDRKGTFTVPEFASIPVLSEDVSAIDLGDVDGDGDLDIIAATKGLKDILLINDGTGQFSRNIKFNMPDVSDGSSDIRFCDINNDGKLDIITTNNEVVGESTLANRVYLNDGTGRFTDKALPPGNEYTNSLDLADIDRDGYIDLAAAALDQNILLINNNSGSFVDGTADYMPINDFASNDIKFGDMNGDGYPDLVILGESEMSLVLNSGSGSFKNGDASIKLPPGYSRLPAETGGKTLQLADINGDGALDIVVGGSHLYILISSPTNKSPVLSPIGNKYAEIGSPLTFNISAVDPNGDDVTYLAQSSDITAFSLTNGTFKWTPTSADAGTVKQINFIARELNSVLPLLQAEENIKIFVSANPPVVTEPGSGPTSGGTSGGGTSTGGTTPGAGQDSTNPGSGTPEGTPTYEAPGAPIVKSAAEQAIVNSFKYFWNETDWNADKTLVETGFVRDRVTVNPAVRPGDTNYNMASVGSTGFGLAAMCIAAEKYGTGLDPDWQVTKAQLRTRVRKIFDKLLYIQGQQAIDPAKWGRDGFFYHFVHLNSGERWMDSEVSTIDTAMLIAGVLTAGEYFGADLKTDSLQIYKNVNWKAFLDQRSVLSTIHTDANPHYMQMFQSWKPEISANSGFAGYWDYTSEGILIYLLAIASPDTLKAIPAESFYSFRRELGNYGVNGNPMVKSWFGPLFVYQYAQAFFNFKNSTGGLLYDKDGVSWWQNSVEATRANRQFCNDNIANYAGQQDLWGLTAGYTVGTTYSIYGAPPAGVPIPSADVHGADGTVHPSAILGSMPLLPADCASGVNKMKELYDNNSSSYAIWGDYGFVNSFKMSSDIANPPESISSFFCGIDTGISALMAENNNSGLIWNYFSGFVFESGKTMRDVLTDKLSLATGNTCTIVLDDPDPASNFHAGYVDSVNKQHLINFNVPAGSIKSGPYLLAMHPYMDKSAGSHTITANIKVNGGAAMPVNFVYDAAGAVSGIMKYIQIDSANLIEGANNTITIEWVSATGSARWLAWENLEMASPEAHGTWSIARDEKVEPKKLFGDEYRTDETYFVGAPVSGFKQALNKDSEYFTDIIFYSGSTKTEYGVLNLKAQETEQGTGTNLQIFLNGSLTPMYAGPIMTGETITTPGFEISSGWNRITLRHSGFSLSAPSGWVTWDSLSIVAADPLKLNAPQGLAAAAYGADKMNLRWQSVTGTNVRYNIYRSQTQGGPYTQINSSPVSATKYQDTSLSSGTTYYYTATAFTEGSITSESVKSTEAYRATGPYEVEFRDGLDPNAFGGQASSQFLSSSVLRHDWTEGAVRMLTLAPSGTATIGLSGADMSAANTLSMWIRGSGGESIEVGLQNPSSSPSVYAVTAASGWQDLKIKLSQFAGVSLTNLDKLSITNTSSSTITILLDDIAFTNEAAGTATLEVVSRNVSNDAPSTGMSFDNDNVNTYAPANQYLAVNYNSPNANNWKIWIYTKNLNGDPGSLGGMYNGLMRSDGKARIALIWRIYPSVQAGGVPCRVTSDVYTSDKMTWNYVKDRNDSDWSTANQTGAEYSVIAFGRKNTWAWLAPVPAAGRKPVGNAFYVYLGGEVGPAGPGSYSASIYMDITHE